MTKTAVQFRSGFRTITPYLVARGEHVVDFIKRVFDGEETLRASTSPGSFHAEMRIGDSMLMVGGGEAYEGAARLVALQVYVPNADDIYRRAIDAGAVSLSEIVEDHGDRFGCVRDRVGNEWYISTHLGAHYIPESLHTVTPWLHPVGAGKLIDFLKQAFGAEELVRYDSPEGRVVHAKIKIGDSVLATSEAHDWWQPLAGMFYLYVHDVDALYDRAIKAEGAKSLSGPKDQPYGDRTAAIEDPFGNYWYIATPVS